MAGVTWRSRCFAPGGLASTSESMPSESRFSAKSRSARSAVRRSYGARERLLGEPALAPMSTRDGSMPRALATSFTRSRTVQSSSATPRDFGLGSEAFMVYLPPGKPRTRRAIALRIRHTPWSDQASRRTLQCSARLNYQSVKRASTVSSRIRPGHRLEAVLDRLRTELGARRTLLAAV